MHRSQNSKPIAIGFDANNYISAAWHATRGDGSRTPSGLFLDFFHTFCERVKPVYTLVACHAAEI